MTKPLEPSLWLMWLFKEKRRMRSNFKRTGNKKSLNQKVSDYFNTHVNPSAGISNQLLNRLANTFCSNHFKGVFASDCIPSILAGQPRFIIIVNLARKKTTKINLGHFVTILATPNCVQYIDPYGMKCIQPDVNRFLHHCGRTIRQNKKQYQDFTSVYCGMFCLLFASYADRLNSVRPPKFKLNFFSQKKKLRQNDIKCVQYLRKLIYD